MPHTRRNPRQPEPNPKPMNLAAIEALVAHHVADAIPNLETNRNKYSRGNGGDNSQGDNRVPTRVCSYNDFRNRKPKILPRK